MFCSNCGRKAETEANFCINCGTGWYIYLCYVCGLLYVCINLHPPRFMVVDLSVVIKPELHKILNSPFKP